MYYDKKSAGGKMAVWSIFLRSTSQKLSRLPTLLLKEPSINNQIRCMSHDQVMMIKSTRWQWSKCKDLLHFYVMLGVIPLSILTFCVNVFVGPATLEPIPEGYTPKPWEYYRHPITRFLVRYVYVTHQQDYEKYLNIIYLEQELRKTRMLQARIEELIEQRSDYKYFYYVPVTAKYVHRARYDYDKEDTYKTFSK
ncbi:NADH dehydrogenase [ubiquinone] 1 beta subcomplex subunit 5, mitochondrial isoform X2 [Vespa crabro]|uniref:NADH dehydrogenase [ubiquinone] 1 beta subcomplex subunit 5, mitochondrial isoform X2 n=1 Tax=Vespa crabro TaxID=7445 RepID=UPI001F0293C3|nr:NADH dehydrogenase [ubiquinone] 1 beta subcomplex subunit 5, mitochondrial isoform X2 [Vespa crabro]